MKKYITCGLLLSSVLAVSAPAFAQRVNQLPPAMAGSITSSAAPSELGTRIAAVVNDNVITTTDLDQRLRLAVLSSGLPDNADVRAHLLPQILRGMIDEQLQVQEAKRLDLSVSDDEVTQTMAHVAKENGIDGDMRTYITAHGGSADALVTQIRNSLLWSKVVQRELRPKVDIGDDEIDAVIERERADAGKQEYLVSEIFLSVDNPKDEDQVHGVADNLLRQLRQGANFSAVARQFSQSAGAAQGGDIGWIQKGQLSPDLDRALSGASAGEISDPIRTTNGYHILGVRDRRTVSLGDPTKISITLMQAFRPYTPTAPKDVVMQDAARLRAAAKSCPTLDSTIGAGFPGWKTQNLGNMNPDKAPQWLADKVRGVAVGNASEPLATDKGAALLFVCARSEGGEADREAILHSIGTEKLELEARRLLRDLRRNAYLDVRLGNT